MNRTFFSKQFFFFKVVVFYTILFPISSVCQKGYYFQNISKGLSQQTVTEFAQDEYGFLWVGTYYGLNRYDGSKFENFNYIPNDPSTLKSGTIRGLVADKKGKVWFGVFGSGLHTYDIHKDKFIHYEGEGSVTNISKIFIDDSGLIWLGTKGSGLHIFDPKAEKFTPYNKEKSIDERIHKEPILSNHIIDIQKDEYGNIWLATDEEGILKIDATTKEITSSTIQNVSQSGSIIRAICLGKNGKNWIGTNKGLHLFDTSGKEIETGYKGEKWELISQSVILSLCENKDDLWIGAEEEGLFKIKISTGDIEHFKSNSYNIKTLSGNSIWSIFKDRDDTMWFGNFLTGINKLVTSKGKVRFISQVSNDWKFWNFKSISSFAESEENLWIGFDGEGLMKLGFDSEIVNTFDTKISKQLTDKNVVSLLNDSQGNLWIGTWGGGVDILKNGETEVQPFLNLLEKTESLGADNILSMTEDSEGRIWLAGHQDCLILYLPKENRIVRFDTDIPGRSILSDLIVTIVPDEDGSVWLGTTGNGLERIKIDENQKIVESEKYFTLAQSGTAFTINDILIDSKKQIWVSTAGEGVFRLDRKSGKHLNFSQADGLPNNLVYSLQEDAEGTIWGSTSLGIFSLNPKSRTVKTYLENNESFSNEYFRTASFKNSKGDIFFGGITGFAQIISDESEEHLYKDNEPEVFITNLDISGKGYTSTNPNLSSGILNNQNLVLESSQNDLSFDFTAVNFAANSQNQFQFKLENYDDKWRLAGTEKNAFYPNIPPKHYKFKVRTSRIDGKWSENESYVNIEIKSPWYKTFSAHLFYALLLIGLFYKIRAEILERLQLKNQLTLEHLELEKMQELDKIKEQFFANISHEFRTPLTLIISPLKTLLEKEKKQENRELLNIMLDNSGYLHRLTNQLLEISKIETGKEVLQVAAGSLNSSIEQTAEKFNAIAKEKSIDFKINTPGKKLILFFDRDKIEKLLVNLLSNAFKYTPVNGKITIDLVETANTVSFSISNTGKPILNKEREKIFERYYNSPGNSSEISSGIGLALSKQIVDLHGGNISADSIEEKKENRTVFTVELRKGIQHLKPEQIVGVRTSISDFSTNSAIKSIAKNDSEKDDRPIILVVEDNEQMRDFIRILLSDEYIVLEASNGEEGFEKAVEFMPEIIISDVMMPLMDGYELSSKLKNNPLTSHIFIILLTAKSSIENVEEGLRSGVDSYIKKPFEPNLLKLNIRNLLKSRNQFREAILQIPATKPNTTKQSFKSKVDEEFIANVVAEIEKRISDPDFKVEDLARAVGFSKSQFYRKLKGLVGKSSNEFIRIIRLKRAAWLLETTQLRVAEITYDVGFNDLEYFRSCFKKEYGISPTKYRKKNLEKKA